MGKGTPVSSLFVFLLGWRGAGSGGKSGAATGLFRNQQLSLQGSLSLPDGLALMLSLIHNGYGAARSPAVEGICCLLPPRRTAVTGTCSFSLCVLGQDKKICKYEWCEEIYDSTSCWWVLSVSFQHCRLRTGSQFLSLTKVTATCVAFDHFGSRLVHH